MINNPPSLISMDRAIARRGLYYFVRMAWPHVEPGIEYIDGWHIRLICRYLEDLYFGRIEPRRLIINIPPGCMKSLLASVFFPAWVWTMEPGHRWLYSSFDDDLSLRDARTTKHLVETDFYQTRWPETRIDKTRKTADAARLYWTTDRGFRMSSTIGGRGTGWHPHTQILDDPMKALEAASATSAAIRTVSEWYSGTMSTRKADARRFARVIVMQRLHMDDISGEMLQQGGWTHLCLPMEYDPDHPYLCADDPRTEPGELLWPGRYDQAAVTQGRYDLGAQRAAAQYDQLPSPAGGAVYHREWARWWDTLSTRGGVVWIQSWDHTFGSKKKSSSYVVGQVWVKIGADAYLVDQVRDRMEFPQMLESISTLSAKWPKAMTKLIEAKASGPALEQMLRKKIAGIVMVKADRTTGGKLARAQSTTGLWESGHIYLPHPTDAVIDERRHPCPWVHDLLERHIRFTGADADVSDEIDAGSQALIHLFGTGSARFQASMAAARQSRRA